SRVAIAVMLGLAVGKPLGIVLFSWLAVRLRIAELPSGVGWRQLVGGGVLSGIGFTMALFIGDLALKDPLLREAKIGVLTGSVVSALLGMFILIVFARPAPAESAEVPAVTDAH